jgi:hypothetical protein
MTAELVSDFDDYDIRGDGDVEEATPSRSGGLRRKAG